MTSILVAFNLLMMLLWEQNCYITDVTRGICRSPRMSAHILVKSPMPKLQLQFTSHGMCLCVRACVCVYACVKAILNVSNMVHELGICT